MKPDEEKDVVPEWMKYASDDLSTAKYLLKGKKYKEASFFCQQCAEKALKALLLHRKRELIKVHDLVKLARELGLDESMIKDCEKLTYVYVDSRYPDTGTKSYTRKETLEDIKIAEGVLKWVRKNLS